MIKKAGYIILILSFFSLLPVHQIFAGVEKKDEITITIPAEVMAKVINDALPVAITQEKAFSGVIWIETVGGLKLADDKVSFSVAMRGEDLGYRGKIGKTPLVLNFGDAKLAFDCNAAIRYDQANNILYVTPEINGDKADETIFVPLLAALTNGREFPIEIQKIEPIIAKFSNNLLTINMDISSITMRNNMLIIGMRPTVKNSPR